MNTSFIISLLLPMTIMYLLMIIRMVERRMKSRVFEYDEKYFRKNSFVTLGYRDFFIAALILDLVQITKVISALATGGINSVETIIAISTFFIHLTLFFLLLPKIADQSPEKRYGKLGYVFDLYIGIIVLFTNALTLTSIILRVY